MLIDSKVHDSHISELHSQNMIFKSHHCCLGQESGVRTQIYACAFGCIDTRRPTGHVLDFIFILYAVGPRAADISGSYLQTQVVGESYLA